MHVTDSSGQARSPGLVPSKSFQLAAARPASVADMIQCGTPFRYSTSLRMNTAAQNAQSAARKPRLLALLCALPIASSSCNQSEVSERHPASSHRCASVESACLQDAALLQ